MYLWGKVPETQTTMQILEICKEFYGSILPENLPVLLESLGGAERLWHVFNRARLNGVSVS